MLPSYLFETPIARIRTIKLRQHGRANSIHHSWCGRLAHDHELGLLAFQDSEQKYGGYLTVLSYCTTLGILSFRSGWHQARVKLL